MSSKVWGGAVPLTAAGALALALSLGGGNDVVAPQIRQGQTAESPDPASAKTLVATGAVRAPATPAARGPDGDANARVAQGNQGLSPTTSAEMLQRAQALREADLAANRGQGPAEACLAQMKMIFCPIIGNMPFIRDVAGQVAMWGHFDCPTGTPPNG